MSIYSSATKSYIIVLATKFLPRTQSRNLGRHLSLFNTLCAVRYADTVSILRRRASYSTRLLGRIKLVERAREHDFRRPMWRAVEILT